MLDGHGRKIDYLRISVTDRCNLRCRYCMPEGIENIPMKEILSFEEIALVAKTAAGLGISKIKITGGEPLVRRGISRLIGMLKGIDGIDQVTLTTNGLLLEELSEELIAAGLDAINISLDTIDHERYRLITGFDRLDSVLKGIDAVMKHDVPVKLNAVSVDWEKHLGVSRKDEDIPGDVLNLIGFAKDIPIDVRFIELMPIGLGKSFPGIPHDELIPKIRDHFSGLEKDESRHGNGPAVYYRIPGYSGSIGFISAIHGIFCDSCNRIRLTSRGYLKSCLCYDIGVDIKETLRKDIPSEEKEEGIRQSIEQCIGSKPVSHSFTNGEKITEKLTMSAIGG